MDHHRSVHKFGTFSQFIAKFLSSKQRANHAGHKSIKKDIFQENVMVQQVEKNAYPKEKMSIDGFKGASGAISISPPCS